MKKLIFINLLILLALSSCGGSKKTTEKPVSQKIEKPKTPTDNQSVKKDEQGLDYDVVKYILRYQDIAKREMKEFGIPVSITLAQGILESQSGQSRLAKEGNNHFGIKCHKDWKGETILHDDNKASECFRKYSNPEQSYKDHSKFLALRKRYAFLFRLPKTDYEAWARGLKKAGYATDPTYPDKLIYIIEKYNLKKFDREVLNDMSVKIDDHHSDNSGNAKKKFIYEVKKGETLFTISRKFNIPVKDIQRINNLNEFDIYEGQILVLTESGDDEMSGVQNTPVQQEETPVQREDVPVQQEETPVEQVETPVQQETNPVQSGNLPVEQKIEVPKNQKPVYVGAYSLHTVKESETLLSISQDYNVSVEDIKKVNGLTSDDIDINTVLKIPFDKVDTGTEKPVETDTATDEIPGAEYHIVKQGETLYRIHVNYGVSIEKLRKLNHLKGNFIKVGQKIRVK